MPSPLEHHTWAEYNARFYTHLGGTQSSWQPWAMTALFYVAVHEVQSLLAQHNLSARTHSARLAALRQRGHWATLVNHYENLQQKSTNARYDCIVHSQAEIALAEWVLNQVRAEVQRLRPQPLRSG